MCLCGNEYRYLLNTCYCLATLAARLPSAVNPQQVPLGSSDKLFGFSTTFDCPASTNCLVVILQEGSSWKYIKLVWKHTYKKRGYICLGYQNLHIHVYRLKCQQRYTTKNRVPLDYQAGPLYFAVGAWSQETLCNYVYSYKHIRDFCVKFCYMKS
jgi:hypothetical protein